MRIDLRTKEITYFGLLIYKKRMDIISIYQFSNVYLSYRRLWDPKITAMIAIYLIGSIPMNMFIKISHLNLNQWEKGKYIRGSRFHKSVYRLSTKYKGSCFYEMKWIFTARNILLARKFYR